MSKTELHEYRLLDLHSGTGKIETDRERDRGNRDERGESETYIVGKTRTEIEVETELAETKPRQVRRTRRTSRHIRR